MKFRAPLFFIGAGPVAAVLTVALLGAFSQALHGTGEPQREQWMRDFLDTRIVPESGGFVFAGDFPTLRWERPLLARELFGDVSLETRWFDASGREVSQPASTGRYAAYIEARPAQGPPLRRSKTFFRFDPGAVTPGPRTPLFQLPEQPAFGLSAAAWEAHREALEDFGNRVLTRALVREEEVAILSAGIADWDESAGVDPLNTPAIRHQEHHLAIKRHILRADHRYPPLDYPGPAAPQAPALRTGTDEEAGFSPELAARLREFCRDWERREGEPFTIVVARHGVIAFHEAFGEEADTDTVYPLFSITKSLTGILAALFIEQGLLHPDEPLGLVLPDLPLSGPNAVTARGCFMHVTGLEGQIGWRGLDNPWLDNHAAHALSVGGPAYRYSGVAYDLVGTALQIISGKSVARLFQEHLFDPLEMENARVTSLGIGGHLRAIDLAKFGQLLLNSGAYGDRRFFGGATLRQILPRAYADHFPGLADRADYGFGLRWAGEPHPRAGHDGIPTDAILPSGRTIGHGSLSGTVFRVDLENELVIAVGRYRSGENHGDYLRNLLLLVTENLVD